MKKVFLLITLLASLLVMNAQVKADLQDYTGHYVFPEGSLAEDAVISIVNDTVLNITASVGECDLKYVEGETFALPQYGGSIVFNRNAENKIDGFTVSIPMAGIDSLEACKEVKVPVEAYIHSNNRSKQPDNVALAAISFMNIDMTLESDKTQNSGGNGIIADYPDLLAKIAESGD
ncbi:hypothetical protein GGR21_000708 [Dysgonomonas hofstadii]|uniref:Lipocalin-like domain-containing protein n=1 Tax=Dysgonomonas hofstadii TaxID=637886 RepID=A0A840CHY6_9BACT|nr:hypothetical protein [Dysgonomonas hofstadii]MBB4034821.1 hypothetical protein [Dysgonomonas hofstadii]